MDDEKGGYLTKWGTRSSKECVRRFLGGKSFRVESGKTNWNQPKNRQSRVPALEVWLRGGQRKSLTEFLMIPARKAEDLRYVGAVTVDERRN